MGPETLERKTAHFSELPFKRRRSLWFKVTTSGTREKAFPLGKFNLEKQDISMKLLVLSQ